MIKHIVALYVAVILSILTGCAARQTPAHPAAQRNVTSFEIRSVTDHQLVDEIEFDQPTTVERGPCRASTDCLIWYQGSEKFERELQDDWSVAYRFEATVIELR